MESLSVLHVQGNPLDQDDIASKIDITKYAPFAWMHMRT